MAATGSADEDFPDFLAIIEQYEEDERAARRVEASGRADTHEIGVTRGHEQLSSHDESENSIQFELARNGRPVIDPAQLISVLHVRNAGVEDDEDEAGVLEEERKGSGSVSRSEGKGGGGKGTTANVALSSRRTTKASPKKGSRAKVRHQLATSSPTSRLDAFHQRLAEKAVAPTEEEWAATPFLWLSPDMLLNVALVSPRGRLRRTVVRARSGHIQRGGSITFSSNKDERQ